MRVMILSRRPKGYHAPTCKQIPRAQAKGSEFRPTDELTAQFRGLRPCDTCADDLQALRMGKLPGIPAGVPT